jgi:hypothetical protein
VDASDLTVSAEDLNSKEYGEDSVTVDVQGRNEGSPGS